MHDIGVQAPHGIEPGGEYVVHATARGGAFAVGDVVQFDLQLADAAVTSLANSGSTSGWGSFTAPTATGVALKLVFGVVQEAIADDAEGKVMIRGHTDAYVIAASGSTAVGSPLVAAAAKNFDLVPEAGECYWALAQEIVTTPTTRALGAVYVDGLRGFGQFVS